MIGTARKSPLSPILNARIDDDDDDDDDGDNDNDAREASLQEMILVISMTIAMKFLTKSLGGDIDDHSDGISRW